MTHAQSRGDRLVGRRHELATIADLVTSVRSGGGTTLRVQAEAGVGKTALLDTAVALARRSGCTVLQASGAAMAAQHPWGVVRQLFGPDLPAEVQTALARDSAADQPPPFATLDLL